MKMRKLIGAALAISVVTTTVPTGAFAYYCPPKTVGFPNGHSGGASVPWFVIGCAGGIILAALAANARDNRELTKEEAWTCGLLFLASQPRAIRVKTKKAVAGLPPVRVKG